MSLHKKYPKHNQQKKNRHLPRALIYGRGTAGSLAWHQFPPQNLLILSQEPLGMPLPPPPASIRKKKKKSTRPRINLPQPKKNKPPTTHNLGLVSGRFSWSWSWRDPQTHDQQLTSRRRPYKKKKISPNRPGPAWPESPKAQGPRPFGYLCTWA